MSANHYPQLAELLRHRLEVIADETLRQSDPDAQLEKLKDVSEKIMALHSNMKESGIHAQLDHFLTNCSFDKALSFVESA